MLPLNGLDPILGTGATYNKAPLQSPTEGEAFLSALHELFDEIVHGNRLGDRFGLYFFSTQSNGYLMLIYRAVLMSTIVWIATSSISLADNPVQTHSVKFLWRVSNAHQEIVKNSLKFKGDMLQDKNAKGAIYIL